MKRPSIAALALLTSLLTGSAVTIPGRSMLARADDPPSQQARVEGLLRGLREAGKERLADELKVRFDRAASQVIQRGLAAHTIYGRVVVQGPDSPKLVQAQMRILDEGYFVGAVAEAGRLVGFQLHGYESVNVLPVGEPGSIEDVGTVVLRPLDEAKKASIRGKVVLEGQPDARGVQVGLSITTGPINSATGGYEGQRGLPIPNIRVPLDGELAGSGYVPTEHRLYISAPGYWPDSRLVFFRPGETLDLGTVRLELGDRVTFTWMVASGGSFVDAKAVTRTVFGQEFCQVAEGRPGEDLAIALFKDGGNRPVLHSHRGPFEAVDLGEGTIEQQANIDHSEARFRNAREVAAESGHVYLAALAVREGRGVIPPPEGENDGRGREATHTGPALRMCRPAGSSPAAQRKPIVSYFTASNASLRA